MKWREERLTSTNLDLLAGDRGFLLTRGVEEFLKHHLPRGALESRRRRGIFVAGETLRQRSAGYFVVDPRGILIQRRSIPRGSLTSNLFEYIML